jgi:hypothetical protein
MFKSDIWRYFAEPPGSGILDLKTGSAGDWRRNLTASRLRSRKPFSNSKYRTNRQYKPHPRPLAAGCSISALEK